MLPMREPVTRLVLEAQAGLVPVTARVSGRKMREHDVRRRPGFGLRASTKPSRSRGSARSGSMSRTAVCSTRSSTRLRLASISSAPRGQTSWRSASASRPRLPSRLPPCTPENAAIHTINQTLFAGPLHREGAGEKRARNAVVVSPGRLDRSPCGTGTSARLAVMHARGRKSRWANDWCIESGFRIRAHRHRARHRFRRRPAGHPSGNHWKRMDHGVSSVCARPVRSISERLSAGRHVARRSGESRRGGKREAAGP